MGWLKIRYLLLIFTLLIGALLCMTSCTPKLYPSGTEANLLGSKQKGRPSELERKRRASSLNRETKRHNRNVERTKRRRGKENQRELARAKKRHFELQHPDVQARMKQNERNTRRMHRANRPLIDRLLNDKNSCPNGY